ncbi:FxLYD domain-containing protein [Aquabacterium humicola]|uniref:FxLYD domain-containing protein n=1 Tax=Aquabacterium humicola TaxID=3237377 RepID=UPI0025432E61|nr:FxLYD domain-containing protein [Rubrivivax pictus]
MLKHLYAALSKIGTGLLYGIGIGITGVALMYFVSEHMMASVWNQTSTKNLQIVKHEKVEREDQTLVLGTVRNDTTEAIRFANVEVDLFDSAGKFVEQCSHVLNGSVSPGEERNFKVVCGGCKDKPTVQHSTYKVRVAGM